MSTFPISFPLCGVTSTSSAGASMHVTVEPDQEKNERGSECIEHAAGIRNVVPSKIYNIVSAYN